MKKKIIDNFFNLAGIQLSLTIVQLLLYPYLTAKIGASQYGQILVMQTTASLLQIIVILGTDLNSIRSVSLTIKSRKKLSNIFCKVILGRVTLAIVSSLVYILVIEFFGYSRVYYFFIFLIFESALTIKWFCHGAQVLRVYSIPYLAGRIISTFTILALIKNEADWYIYPIIYSSIALFCAIYSFSRVISLFCLSFVYVKFRYVYMYFFRSRHLFFTNIVSALKDRTAVFIISGVVGDNYVVYYDFCYKIADMVASLFSSFSASLYPSFVSHFDIKKFDSYSKKIAFLSLVPFFLSSLFLQEIINLVDYVIGMNIDSMRRIYWLFGIMIFVRGHGYFLGLCFLMSHNKSKDYSASLIMSGLVYISSSMLLLIFDASGLLPIAVTVSISLIIEYGDRYFRYKRIRAIYGY